MPPAKAAERTSDRRQLFTNLATLSVSLVITLLAAEGVLRALGYDRLRSLENGRELIIRPSDIADLKYELRPGAQGRAWGTSVSINSFGFRGPEVDPDKGEQRRILILGDSITFGNRLPREVVYPSILARHFRGRGVQILNFGVGGYDVLQEISLLEHRGLRFQPDCVVLGYCLNDAGVHSANLNYVSLSGSRWLRSRLVQLVLHTLELRSSWREHQNQPEVFARNYSERIEPIDESETELLSLMRAADDRFPTNFYRDPVKVGRIRYSFQRFRKLADEHGFRPLVVIIPLLEEQDGRYPHAGVHRIVAGEADACGLPVLDLASPFLEVGVESLRIQEHDPIHPNEDGHRLIAEALGAFLKSDVMADDQGLDSMAEGK